MKTSTYTEGQHYRMAGLNLLTAIAIHWKTLHLGQATAKRKQEGQSNPADLLARISALEWTRILLTCEHSWPKNR